MAGEQRTRAILHIGMEKTGTTTLQSTLYENRARLEEAGFVYSKSAGGTNHTQLANYSLADDDFEGMRARAGIRNADDLAQFRDRVDRAMAGEIAANPDKIFVFSNEHCQSQLTEEADVRRLHDLMTRHFDRVDVILYLRRQDRVAVSRYSTRLKAGFVPKGVLAEQGGTSSFYDYLGLVERWAAVFSPERLQIAIHGPGELANGSIVDDFRERCGLPELEEDRERKNVELDAIYQEYLEHMNAELAGEETPAVRYGRERLQTIIADIGAGSGKRPSRAEAEEFYSAYRDDNEQLRATFLPDRELLFDEDFSQYPEEPNKVALDVETALDISADLWQRIAHDNYRLSSALYKAKGNLYLVQGKLKLARRNLQMAVRRVPDDAQNWYLLGRVHVKSGEPEEALVCAKRALELRPKAAPYQRMVENLEEELQAAGAESA